MPCFFFGYSWHLLYFIFYFLNFTIFMDLILYLSFAYFYDFFRYAFLDLERIYFWCLHWCLKKLILFNLYNFFYYYFSIYFHKCLSGKQAMKEKSKEQVRHQINLRDFFWLKVHLRIIRISFFLKARRREYNNRVTE